MTDRPLNILALGKYGELAASSRQRMVQYRAPLAEHGISLTHEPLLPNEYVKALSEGRRAPWRMLADAYARRVKRLFSLDAFDAVWVEGDLLPYAPGIFEVIPLGRHPSVVYDCDDAIFHNYNRHRNPLVRFLLGRKLEPLLRRATAATCGNDYLRAYVSQYCAASEIVPTVVDTTVYQLRRPTEAPSNPTVVVGWIGSPSTWSYVKPFATMLRAFKAKGEATFRAIGVGPQSRVFADFEFSDWALETEVDEIQRFDIGIMPLTDDPWSRGKCGYKLIQYMACGLPVVASPVGVNTKLVRHGETGFLATTEKEWADAIYTLIADPALRARMGSAGRALVEREYSLASQVPRVAGVLRRAAA